MDIQTPVYLRADGNSQTGLGHVHRLLALNEILKDGFNCKFIIRSPLKGIRDLILENCSELIEIEGEGNVKEIQKIATFLTGKEIVVLDGYHFGTEYQTKIKETGSTVVCVDDIHNYHFVADVILNPAGGVPVDLYSKESYTQLYIGPGVAPLKKPFRLASKNRTEKSNNSIFICMGGADPGNHTLSTLRYCLRFPFESYYVIIGEAYKYSEQLHQEVKNSGKQIKILSNLDPQTLAETMKLCATAVCSASGIAYEYLSVGGALYIKETAANQKLMYTYLLQEGLAYRLEDLPVDREKVADSWLKQKEIFDGDVDKRILAIFNKLDFDLHVLVRKAKESDLTTVFQWANDPEVRRQSFSSASITLESHSTWFEKKINDPSTLLYIFEYKNLPIAQVRFDIQQEAIISYLIDKMFRGRGWGTFVLQKAIEAFGEEYKRAIKIIAFVKHENASSNTIFKKLGFEQSEANEYPNSFKYQYINHDRNKG